MGRATMFVVSGVTPLLGGCPNFSSVISVPPFEGARGVVLPTRNNITGTYRYEPYSATTFGLFVGLDVELDKHWQVNASYKFGSGHGISNNNLKERGSIWLNSLELGISYLF